MDRIDDMDSQLLHKTVECDKQRLEYMELMNINKQMIRIIRVLEAENKLMIESQSLKTSYPVRICCKTIQRYVKLLSQ